MRAKFFYLVIVCVFVSVAHGGLSRGSVTQRTKTKKNAASSFSSQAAVRLEGRGEELFLPDLPEGVRVYRSMGIEEGETETEGKVEKTENSDAKGISSEQLKEEDDRRDGEDQSIKIKIISRDEEPEAKVEKKSRPKRKVADDSNDDDGDDNNDNNDNNASNKSTYQDEYDELKEDSDESGIDEDELNLENSDKSGKKDSKEKRQGGMISSSSSKVASTATIKAIWDDFIKAPPSYAEIKEIIAKNQESAPLHGSEDTSHVIASGGAEQMQRQVDSMYRQMLAQFISPLVTISRKTSNSNNNRVHNWLDPDFALQLKGLAVLALKQDTRRKATTADNNGNGNGNGKKTKKISGAKEELTVLSQPVRAVRFNSPTGTHQMQLAAARALAHSVNASTIVLDSRSIERVRAKAMEQNVPRKLLSTHTLFCVLLDLIEEKKNAAVEALEAGARGRGGSVLVVLQGRPRWLFENGKQDQVEDSLEVLAEEIQAYGSNAFYLMTQPNVNSLVSANSNNAEAKSMQGSDTPNLNSIQEAMRRNQNQNGNEMPMNGMGFSFPPSPPYNPPSQDQADQDGPPSAFVMSPQPPGSFPGMGMGMPGMPQLPLFTRTQGAPMSGPSGTGSVPGMQMVLRMMFLRNGTASLMTGPGLSDMPGAPFPHSKAVGEGSMPQAIRSVLEQQRRLLGKTGKEEEAAGQKIVTTELELPQLPMFTPNLSEEDAMEMMQNPETRQKMGQFLDQLMNTLAKEVPQLPELMHRNFLAQQQHMLHMQQQGQQGQGQGQGQFEGAPSQFPGQPNNPVPLPAGIEIISHVPSGPNAEQNTDGPVVEIRLHMMTPAAQAALRAQFPNGPPPGHAVHPQFHQQMPQPSRDLFKVGGDTLDSDRVAESFSEVEIQENEEEEAVEQEEEDEEEEEEESVKEGEMAGSDQGKKEDSAKRASSFFGFPWGSKPGQGKGRSDSSDGSDKSVEDKGRARPLGPDGRPLPRSRGTDPKNRNSNSNRVNTYNSQEELIGATSRSVLSMFEELVLEPPADFSLRSQWDNVVDEERKQRVSRANLRTLRQQMVKLGLAPKPPAMQPGATDNASDDSSASNANSVGVGVSVERKGSADGAARTLNRLRDVLSTHVLPAIELAAALRNAVKLQAGCLDLFAAEEAKEVKESHLLTKNSTSAAVPVAPYESYDESGRYLLSYWALDSALSRAMGSISPRFGRPHTKTKDDILNLPTADKHEKALSANVISPKDLGVTYDMIGGLQQVKESLRQCITYPLKYPRLYSEGVAQEAVKGVLLFGPPGTGKTMLAKAVATEGGATFLTVDASTIENKWLGESEKNARAVFTLARQLAPCVIYLDEVDSVLSSREGGDDSSHGTLTSVKTTLMQEWDGLRTTKDRVVVIASTNRPFDLDEAVLRRLPRRILVDLPDLKTRAEVMAVTLKDNRLAPDVNLTAIAETLEGYSGSDIKEVCREAVVRVSHERAQLLEGVSLSEGATATSDTRDVAIDTMLDGEEDFLRPVSARDFKMAAKKLKASVNDNSRELQKVMEWNEKYGEMKETSKGRSRNQVSMSMYI